VFGINFCSLDLSALVALLVREPVPPNEAARLVATTNLDHIVNLTRNSEFRQAYSRAWAVTADGTPVFLYAKLRGSGLPCRIPGPDLFAALMLKLSPDAHRPFFVVSSMDTGGRLSEWLLNRGFNALSFEILSPKFGFERDAEYSISLAKRIKSHKTTHLIFGVGAPKSEIWLDRYRFDLGNCFALGIGAGVDYFVETQRRSPLWMRRLGLEWLWRFACEPRRLFRRYFIDSWLFFAAIKNDLIRHSV
jgi:N-acetylglucosaminyldiphosphoundecaprenol N-acetyl-beta-D-mannosaminyltransferase